MVRSDQKNDRQEMTKSDLEQLISPERFSPFLIATVGGYSIAIDEETSANMLLGRNVVVIMDKNGDFVHLPYRSIDHIEERQ